MIAGRENTVIPSDTTITRRGAGMICRMSVFIIFVVFVAACNQEGFDTEATDFSASVQVSEYGLNSIPTFDNRSANYVAYQFSGDNTGALIETQFAYNSDVGWYIAGDSSVADAGIPYLLLTAKGWENRVTQSANINKISDIDIWQQQIADVLIENRYLGSRDLSGQPLTEVLGDNATWAQDYVFAKGATLHEFSAFVLSDVVSISSESCGPACYEYGRLPFSSLDEFRRYYASSSMIPVNLDDGFYFLGLSMFLMDDGSVQIYRYDDPDRLALPVNGSWIVRRVNNETILEILIPPAYKRQQGVRAEVNPVVARAANGQLYLGSHMTTSSNIPAEHRIYRQFIDQVALDSVKSAYIDYKSSHVSP